MKIKYCLKRNEGTDEGFPEVTDASFQEVETVCKPERALEHPEWKHLKASYEDGFAVVAIDPDAGNLVVGYTRIHPLLTSLHPIGAWFELGSTWVREEYRGRYGVLEAMYDLLLSTHADKNILATTIDRKLLDKTARVFRFALVHRKSLPEDLWRATCFCSQEKTGAKREHDNVDCKLAWGEPQLASPSTCCWIRVTRETAARNNLVPDLAP